MGSRPRLRPDFQPLRRGLGAVQLGSDAAGGIIVAGLSPGEISLLDRLDGSLHEEDLYAAAERAGVVRERATQLLDLLRTHRVLLSESTPAGGWPGSARRRGRPDSADSADSAEGPLDGPADRARGDPTPRPIPRPERADRQWVVVDGAGPFPASVALLLRGGGLGRVDAGPWAADVADAELRETGHRRGRPGPALVVLVGTLWLDPRAGESWRRRGIPLLPVVVDGGRVVVGPVVGPDPALPCLRCLQLRRVDADTAWFGVLAQDSTGEGGEGGAFEGWVAHADPEPLRPDVASVAAGATAMVAQAVVGNDPVPPAVSVEVGAPWPRLDHRRWTRHPACRAHGPGPGPGGFEGPGREPARLG